MGTEEVKAHLDVYYPGRVFKRLLKVKDDLGYTHRFMQSHGDDWKDDFTVVVTTDVDEDSEICEMFVFNEYVNSFTLKSDLKDSKRPWRSGGTFQGLICDKLINDEHETMWLISPGFLWDKHKIISGGHGLDPLLEAYGFECLTESVYTHQGKDEDVEALLVSKGAKPVFVGLTDV